MESRVGNVFRRQRSPWRACGCNVSLHRGSVHDILWLSGHDLRAAPRSGFAKSCAPDLSQPEFEGVTLGGVLAVVYTKHALGSMWDGGERPYSDGYAADDARRIGMNLIVYAMTH